MTSAPVPITAVHMAESLIRDCRRLNEEVRQNGTTMTLAQTKQLMRALREASGWMKGVKELVEQYIGTSGEAF